MRTEAQLADVESRAEFVRVRGPTGHIAWRRWGDGPPLVLLHGGHGSWRHWARNIEALSRTHSLWLPDLPGFGDSDDLAADARSAGRMALMVDAVIDGIDRALGPSSPIGLGGFSFGGLVAASVAARRGRVSRLALVGSAGHDSPRRQMEPMRDWRVDDPAAMRDALRQNLRILMLHDPSRIDDLAMAIHETSCRHTRFRSRALSRAGSLQRVLSEFDAPVLGLWGLHDAVATPEEAGPLLCGGHPLRQWHVVGDAGHWVQYEQADAVNHRLAEWFA